MKAFLFLLAATLTLSLAAEEIKVGTVLDELSTAEGKTYTGAKITRIDGDSITIMHSGGIARVPAEFLPTEILEKLGFTEDGVAAVREEAKRAELSRATIPIQTTTPQAQTAGEEVAGTFLIRQIQEDGSILASTHRRGGVAGSAARAMGMLTGRSGSSYVASSTSSTFLYLTGVPTEGLVDDDIIDVVLIDAGETHQYESLLGGLQTVRALSFLRWAD